MRCFAPLARSAVVVLVACAFAAPGHAQGGGARGGIVDEVVSFEGACERVRALGAFRRVDIEVRSRFEAMPTSAALQSCFLRDAQSALEVVVSSARAGGGGDSLVLSLRATNNGSPLVDKREVLGGPGGGAAAVQMLARSLQALAEEMRRLPGAPDPERCARLKAAKATVIVLISERAVDDQGASVPHTPAMARLLSEALLARCVQVVDGLGGVPLGDLVRDNGPYAVRGEVLISTSRSGGMFNDPRGQMRSYSVQTTLDLVNLDSETRLGSVQGTVQLLGISPANAIKGGAAKTNKTVTDVADQLAVKIDDHLRAP